MSKALTHIRSLARNHTDRAIQVLQGIMDQPDAPHAARVAAANSLLDRGWGKPTQPIAGDDEGDELRLSIIRRVIVDRIADTDSAGIQASTEPGEV